MATTVDTLSYAKRLQQAGVDREAAEAHAEALRDFVVPELATKADLDALETRLRGHIEVMLWKHTAGIILGVLAVGGLLLRFVR